MPVYDFLVWRVVQSPHLPELNADFTQLELSGKAKSDTNEADSEGKVIKRQYDSSPRENRTVSNHQLLGRLWLRCEQCRCVLREKEVNLEQNSPKNHRQAWNKAKFQLKRQNIEAGKWEMEKAFSCLAFQERVEILLLALFPIPQKRKGQSQTY